MPFIHQPKSEADFYDSAARPHPVLDEIASLIKYKDLIAQFVSRAIKTRYKRSVLGVVWTMLNPLLTMIILSVVFSQILRVQVRNYPVYILSGQISWIFFATSTHFAMGEMIWSGDLLKRIFVPKSVFAVSSVGTGLVNMGLSLLPLLAIAAVLGVLPSWALLTWPFAIALMAIFALGIGLILATAVVYFADMLPIYEVLLQIWFYATPIIYPMEIIPVESQWLFRLNPMYYLIELFRYPLMNGGVPGMDIWLPALGVSVTSLILGAVIFTARSREYAYRI